MKIEHTVLDLQTTHPFNIARAAAPPVRRSVWLRLTDDDGNEGWGEAAPNAYYGESVETVIALLPAYERALQQADADVLELDTLERACERATGGNPAARAGISAALHDLAGKRIGIPVWSMWGLSADAVPRSSFTIGIDEPDVMRRKLEEAASYPILKLKVGTPDDRQMLEMVRRAAPDCAIRIDANTGWTLEQALALLPLLEELRIELIEQPFDAADIESFRTLRERSPIPIIADESCRTVADIPHLVGAVDGINIKLEKCGSLREAVRMVQVARAHQLQVMIGCMLSTTLAVAATMQLAPLVDYVDLDAARLLAADPFVGPAMESDGTLRLSADPGLGVRRG
ncbi:dipeptide epimerase [soil metagenome]